jgi:hypothetical protein
MCAGSPPSARVRVCASGLVSGWMGGGGDGVMDWSARTGPFGWCRPVAHRSARPQLIGQQAQFTQCLSARQGLDSIAQLALQQLVAFDQRAHIHSMVMHEGLPRHALIIHNKQLELALEHYPVPVTLRTLIKKWLACP